MFYLNFIFASSLNIIRYIIVYFVCIFLVIIMYANINIVYNL